MDNIDFTGGGNTEPTGTPNNNANNNPATEPDTTHLSGGGVDDITKSSNANPSTSNSNPNPNPVDDNNNDDQQNSSTGVLEQGTEVEFNGSTYTVDSNGNIVDAQGNIFKEAKDVKSWLDDDNASEDDNSDDVEELSIANIRNLVGIDVTDEQGNPIEFTNDATGVKSYLDSVLAIKSNEWQSAAVNKLFASNPLLKEFINYVQLTGTARGFGDIPDRSGIQLDKDNETQLVAVIKMAANEFGNASLNDNYINYLKQSGTLYDEAKRQLDALVQKDNNVRDEINRRAEIARAQEERDVANYWTTVANTINKGIVNGYKIPTAFVKEINGQKITLTKTDFYNYLSKPIKADDGSSVMTGYQRDLNSLSDEELLNKELLDAWLMFTGGSYKDLIDMAVKEDKVHKLVVKSKQNRSVSTVKIKKPNKSKVDMNDILF